MMENNEPRWNRTAPALKGRWIIALSNGREATVEDTWITSEAVELMERWKPVAASTAVVSRTAAELLELINAARGEFGLVRYSLDSAPTGRLSKAEGSGATYSGWLRVHAPPIPSNLIFGMVPALPALTEAEVAAAMEATDAVRPETSVAAVTVLLERMDSSKVAAHAQRMTERYGLESHLLDPPLDLGCASYTGRVTITGGRSGSGS